MSGHYVELGELAAFLNGGTPKRDVARYYEGSIPWITSADLEDEADFITEARFYITQEAIDSSATRIVPKGNLLFVSRTGVGKVAIAGVDICISQDFTGILPNKELIDTRYLLHFLRARQPYFVAHQRGATIKGVTRRVIEELPVPLPPLDEQKRIAAVLDAADALRAKRRTALAKLDTLLQSVFLEMFGDPVANPMGWEVQNLSDVVKEGTSVTYGIVQAGPEIENGVPYIKTGDIQNGKITESGLSRTSPDIAARFERSTVREDELVMSIRATVGTIAKVPAQLDGANLTQGTARVSPGALVLPDYLLWHIRSHGSQHWLERQVKGATFREITLTKLRTLPVMIPPLETQREFRCIANKVEKQVAVQVGHLDANNRLFGSLQQRAFKGEL